MTEASAESSTGAETAAHSGSRGPLRLFYSYSHEDAPILDQLRKHLAPLRHERIVVDWYDREILPGSAWERRISERLEAADIVLALISADFIASRYAYGRELTRALELHDRGRLVLVPVIARPSYWQRLPIAHLQVLPEGANPITTASSSGERDASFVSVVQGVERVARELLARSEGLADQWLESRLIRRRVIREVQVLLHELDHYDGPLDGIPGRETERAVFAFQRRAGISIDAQIGPEVIRNLEETVNRDRRDESPGSRPRREAPG